MVDENEKNEDTKESKDSDAEGSAEETSKDSE